VNQLGVDAPRAAERAADSPADALATVIDNAGALARAELRLATAEAKAWLVRMSLGVWLFGLGLLLTQSFVLLVALAPYLLTSLPWPRVALMLLLSFAPTLGALLLGARELRKLKDTRHESHRDN